MASCFLANINSALFILVDPIYLFIGFIKYKMQLGTVVHNFNPSIPEAVAGGIRNLTSQP